MSKPKSLVERIINAGFARPGGQPTPDETRDILLANSAPELLLSVARLCAATISVIEATNAGDLSAITRAVTKLRAIAIKARAVAEKAGAQ